VTPACPELVELVLRLDAHELIFDGEAIALRKDGRPHPFQTTMRRFGRRLDVEAMRRALPLSAFFFDCLYLNGESLLELGADDRYRRMCAVLPEHARVPRIVTDDRTEAERFLEAAIRAGHEGVMAKALSASYEAGARGKHWLKVKLVHTLDLVVLGAEWGSGRRRGYLSNLHLGARDLRRGGFVMLGKTFKGMTDEILAWQTKRLLEIERERDAHTVYVRPELVVEIACNDIQKSPHYPGGMALRFARLKAYRDDKSVEEADSIDRVRELYRQQTGQETTVSEQQLSLLPDSSDSGDHGVE
jgi:DNA ligase-1